MNNDALAAQGLLRRMAVVAPEAWRRDKVFRWASIGAGVTLALLFLRLADPPRSPGETRSGALPMAAVISMPGPSLPIPGEAVSATVPDVPKIAPGHALEDVTEAPAPQGDRFGTLKPASRP